MLIDLIAQRFRYTKELRCTRELRVHFKSTAQELRRNFLQNIVKGEKRSASSDNLMVIALVTN